MKLRSLSGMTVVTMLATVGATSVLAQQSQGRLYPFHTLPKGGCRGLDWRLVWTPSNNALNGFVAWDGGEHIAKLSGTANRNGDFQMNARKVGGAGRTAVVKGSAKGDEVKIQIQNSGTPCDETVLTIPRAVGGMEGGS